MPFSYEKARQALLEEQAQLKEQLQQLETEAAEYGSIGYSNHMADDATDAFDQAVGVTLKRNVEASLEDVARALARLDDGTYGLCESCGARIDRARLEALPRVRYCLECQSRHEQTRTASR
jgi:DnaK suppressor protein